MHSGHGGPEALCVVELPLADPGPGEVRVDVRAAGVNPVDWKISAGSFVTDGAGTDMRVDFTAVGSGATSFEVGDEVIVTGAHSACTESLVARIDQVDRQPASVGWEQTAGLGIPGLRLVPRIFVRAWVSELLLPRYLVVYASGARMLDLGDRVHRPRSTE